MSPVWLTHLVIANKPRTILLIAESLKDQCVRFREINWDKINKPNRLFTMFHHVCIQLSLQLEDEKQDKRVMRRYWWCSPNMLCCEKFENPEDSHLLSGTRTSKGECDSSSSKYRKEHATAEKHGEKHWRGISQMEITGERQMFSEWH